MLLTRPVLKIDLGENEFRFKYNDVKQYQFKHFVFKFVFAYVSVASARHRDLFVCSEIAVYSYAVRLIHITKATESINVLRNKITTTLVWHREAIYVSRIFWKRNIETVNRPPDERNKALAHEFRVNVGVALTLCCFSFFKTRERR